ncbi:hypothetical protein Tco_0667738 [Tanacetum coccineum]
MKQRSRRPKRKGTQVPQSSVPSDNVADEDVPRKLWGILIALKLDEGLGDWRMIQTREIAVLMIMKNIYLVIVRLMKYRLMFNDLDGDACCIHTEITDVEITLAQALAELKSAKPKADKVVIQEPEQGTTKTTPTLHNAAFTFIADKHQDLRHKGLFF